MEIKRIYAYHSGTNIITTMQQFPEIEKAAIFGSRVKGNYKPGSDVDIAIWGNDISFSTLSRLHAILEEESPMPYFFDIVDYSHLNRHGHTLEEKSRTA